MLGMKRMGIGSRRCEVVLDAGAALLPLFWFGLFSVLVCCGMKKLDIGTWIGHSVRIFI